MTTKQAQSDSSRDSSNRDFVLDSAFRIGDSENNERAYRPLPKRKESIATLSSLLCRVCIEPVRLALQIRLEVLGRVRSEQEFLDSSQFRSRSNDLG